MAKQAFGPVSSAPYSSGIKTGGLAFVSGQIGQGETVAEQTASALANLTTVLAAAGLDLSDVVKTTVFLTDVTTIAEMNEVYCATFPEPLPCRSTIGVNGLPAPELKVEIEAIAQTRS